MTEEVKEKKVFKLSEKELSNPKYRKGYPGRYTTVYPNTTTWKSTAEMPHPNYDSGLSSVYRAGQYVGVRGELIEALQATLPPPKVKKSQLTQE